MIRATNCSRKRNQAREEAEDRLVSAADALAAAREEVAPRFSAAVTAQMARLEMGSASLVVELQDLTREAWDALGNAGARLSVRSWRRAFSAKAIGYRLRRRDQSCDAGAQGGVGQLR